jgi:SAM-dependent methyltransferase
MDRSAYAGMSAIESHHWWFVARRTLIRKMISVLPLPAEPRILEAGCGTGGNLAMLAEYGKLTAFEYDAEARETATAKGICSVVPGCLPDQITTGDNAFDLIAMLDVLEHIDDDVGSLKALGAKLAADGRLLVTVPALPFLWSSHDELHHHKRRYTRSSLSSVARSAGLEIERVGYFNSLLFPIAALQRGWAKLRRHSSGVDTIPSAPINSVLKTMFAAERHVVGWGHFPIGLSLFAVLRPKSA